MDRYVICGGERLSGQVKISGAKNAVLPILAGTLMTKNAVLKNVPNLSDVAYTVEILENLGTRTPSLYTLWTAISSRLSSTTRSARNPGAIAPKSERP